MICARAGLTMPAVRVSALRGDGLRGAAPGIARAIEALGGDHQGDTVAISRERHREALARALAALADAADSARAAMPPEIIAVDMRSRPTH